MAKDKELTPAEQAAKKRQQAARRRKAQREAKERAAERKKKRAQSTKRSQSRREQLQEAEGVKVRASKKRRPGGAGAAKAKRSGAGIKTAAQRAAERAQKRKEARRRAVERAKSRSKAKPAERKGGLAGVMSATQRSAEKAKRREARRQRSQAAAAVKATRAAEDEELTEQFAQLDAKFEDIYQTVSLNEISDDLEDTDSTLATLPVGLETLRSRGYVFKSFLEKKITVLQEQWDDMQERVLDEVDERSKDLLQEADEAAALLDQARGRSGSSAKRQLDRCESVLKRVESKVDAAQQSLEGMYDTLEDNVTQTQSQLEAIEWALDQVDEANFRLYPAEALVAACQAQLLERGDDKGPKGIFYLTDERVLFEQKEEIATKKVLFVTTEKKTIQELLFEVAIGNVEELKATDKGTIRHKELLELNFGGDASLRRAHLRLLGGADSQDWQGFIGRVVSGDVAQERVEPKDEQVVEAARSAPTECSTCGAQFSQTIVRGMQEITCDYCGAVVRL